MKGRREREDSLEREKKEDRQGEEKGKVAELLQFHLQTIVTMVTVQLQHISGSDSWSIRWRIAEGRQSNE